MKQKIKTELYVSPEVEVVEVKAQQVICQSGQLGAMTNNGEEW